MNAEHNTYVSFHYIYCPFNSYVPLFGNGSAIATPYLLDFRSVSTFESSIWLIHCKHLWDSCNKHTPFFNGDFYTRESKLMLWTTAHFTHTSLVTTYITVSPDTGLIPTCSPLPLALVYALLPC